MTVAFAWKEEDDRKAVFKLSMLEKGAKWGRTKPRPAATFETPQELMKEASRRKLTVEWEDGYPV